MPEDNYLVSSIYFLAEPLRHPGPHGAELHWFYDGIGNALDICWHHSVSHVMVSNASLLIARANHFQDADAVANHGTVCGLPGPEALAWLSGDTIHVRKHLVPASANSSSISLCGLMTTGVMLAWCVLKGDAGSGTGWEIAPPALDAPSCCQLCTSLAPSAVTVDRQRTSQYMVRRLCMDRKVVCWGRKGTHCTVRWSAQVVIAPHSLSLIICCHPYCESKLRRRPEEDISVSHWLSYSMHSFQHLRSSESWFAVTAPCIQQQHHHAL